MKVPRQITQHDAAEVLRQWLWENANPHWNGMREIEPVIRSVLAERDVLRKQVADLEVEVRGLRGHRDELQGIIESLHADMRKMGLVPMLLPRSEA